MRWLPLALVMVLVGAAAGTLLPTAPLTEPLLPPRGRLANVGLDHAEQSDPPPELQPSPEARPEVQVELRGAAFEPAWMSVPPGTTVVFWNRDAEAHTVTARLGGEALFDERLEPGMAAQALFDRAGDVELRCRYHSQGFEPPGMVATVQVG